ncbi:toprim domain-containing protein, partial [Candidatus Dojkabacteria bacterium]|nr:toprim domain-containing protein [Candidatus Dojkabacteria bacterium]
KKMDIKKLLQDRNILIKKAPGDELVIDCLVNNCDTDSAINEAHFYINSSTGAFQCKKCGVEGGLKELLAILGIDKVDSKKKEFTPYDYQRYETQLEDNSEIMDYLIHKRGLKTDTIKQRHLGFGKFFGRTWITIPYFDEKGNFLNLYKLRAPEGSNSASKYLVYPTKAETRLYGLELLDTTQNNIFICEGEFDSMILNQHGHNAISIGSGAQTFKDDWLESLKPFDEISICFDNDPAGEAGALKLIQKLGYIFPLKQVIKHTIPHDDGAKDVSDLLNQKDGFYKLMGSTEIVQKPPVMKRSMSIGELADVLDLTIKEDKVNKILAFLCFLSMYTENSQFNIIFNGPSSSGKTYIPLEIAKLFPEEDVIDLGKVTNQAFFYEQGEYDQETNSMIIDYSRKTLLFMDQPNTEVISKIRPLLSHDKKVITNKMTDSNLKYGTKTKTAKIVGFCSVVFCTTDSLIDEQELTRVILLSPDTSPKKIKRVIEAKINSQSSIINDRGIIESNPIRQELMSRILDIKYAAIKDFYIPNKELLEELLHNGKHQVSTRDTRDITKIFSLIHVLALLNYRFRDKTEDGRLQADDQDIYDAFSLWNEIRLAQETGISPHVLGFVETIVKDLFKERQSPDVNTEIRIKREDFIKKYSVVHNTILDDKSMINKYLRPLCYAGILEELKGDDRRENVYALTTYGKNILNVKGGIPSIE